mgnify:CR=1 FL=1
MINSIIVFNVFVQPCTLIFKTPVIFQKAKSLVREITRSIMLKSRTYFKYAATQDYIFFLMDKNIL